jgi:hypothetical protein
MKQKELDEDDCVATTGGKVGPTVPFYAPSTAYRLRHDDRHPARLTLG